MEYVCNFLNHNGSYVGPSMTIDRASVDSAVEEALERLAAYPEYHGFDLLEDGERKYRFKRTFWPEES
jgi:hypothetical protein